MSRGYPRHRILLNSANSSTYTSSAICVHDAANIALSIQTVVATASTFTVQGSLDHGLNGAITNWSTVTSLSAFPFLGTIDPGVRWIRVQRTSVESQATVQVTTWGT